MCDRKTFNICFYLKHFFGGGGLSIDVTRSPFGGGGGGKNIRFRVYKLYNVVTRDIVEIDFSSFSIAAKRVAYPLHHRVATGQFLFLIIFNTVIKIIFQPNCFQLANNVSFLSRSLFELHNSKLTYTFFIYESNEK